MINILALLLLIGNAENRNGDIRALGVHGEMGLYQISLGALAHVNDRYNTHYTRLDLLDTHKSQEVGVFYLRILHAHYRRRTGKNPKVEHLVRMWNGGPNGYHKSSTINYWRTFKRVNQGRIKRIYR